MHFTPFSKENFRLLYSGSFFGDNRFIFHVAISVILSYFVYPIAIPRNLICRTSIDAVIIVSQLFQQYYLVNVHYTCSSVYCVYWLVVGRCCNCFLSDTLSTPITIILEWIELRKCHLRHHEKMSILSTGIGF